MVTAQSKTSASPGEERKSPAVRLLATRAAVAVAILIIGLLTVAPQYRRLLVETVTAYVATAVLLVATARGAIEQRRVRIFTHIVDMLAISALIGIFRGTGSLWSLLYVFPVMAVARSLGAPWSIAVAVLATLSYWATSW